MRRGEVLGLSLRNFFFKWLVKRGYDFIGEVKERFRNGRRKLGEWW